MDIYWYGQACFKIKGKSATVVIDPFNPEFVGLKGPKPQDLECDVVLKTHDHGDHNFFEGVGGTPLQISGPGEYEVKGVTITGVGVFHDKSSGSERGRNTIYNIEIDGLRIVHVGDLGHTLSEEQVDEVGDCDILLVPVGSVYTINGEEASEVVAQLEPKIIVPMHYLLPGLKFQLDSVDLFLKEMGAENPQPQSKLSITKDKLPEEPQVVMLSKQ